MRRVGRNNNSYYWALGAVQQQQHPLQITIYCRATYRSPLTAYRWRMLSASFSDPEAAALEGLDVEAGRTPVPAVLVHATNHLHVFGYLGVMQSHHIVNPQTLPVESRRALQFDNFSIQSATYCSRNDVIFTSNTECKIVAYRCRSRSWSPIGKVQDVRKIALITVLDGRYLVMFITGLHCPASNCSVLRTVVLDIRDKILAPLPVAEEFIFKQPPIPFVDDEKSYTRLHADNLLAGFYGHNKSASYLPQTLRAMCIAYLIGPPSLHLFTQSKTHHRITLRVLRNEILAAIKAKKPCVSKKQVQISWLEYDVNVNREICPEYV